MYCFYHTADLDGHCSGAIVKYWYPECKMIPFHYGQEFPFDEVKDQNVIMSDLSLQPFDGMLKILDVAKRFVWIDHHKTAIDACEKSGRKIEGLRDSNFAACELTWQYMSISKDKVPSEQDIREFPRAVRLLGRYDVWDHKDSDVLPFQYGMRAYRTDPKDGDFDWIKLLNKTYPDEIDAIAKNGRAILKYQTVENEAGAKHQAFECNLDGYRCIVINGGILRGSQLVDSVFDPNKHDIRISFGFVKDHWDVSLYSTKVDVGAIAKKYGGGGHRNAAGFQCYTDCLKGLLKVM